MLEILYHGSPHKDIQDKLLPGTITGTSDRDQVFAAPDKDLAALYTLSGGPGDFIVDKKEKRIFFPKSSSELTKRDRGGVVYHVLPDGLEPQSNPNMASEWTGDKATIVDKTAVRSALVLMYQAGYSLYADFDLFCDVEECVLATGEFPQRLITQYHNLTLPEIYLRKVLYLVSAKK